jgi:hypothetical protein
MSKISLTPNALGTGTLTIAAPNTSTNRTLTLPDETGTFLLGTQPAGDIVGTTATQTLTNKDIVATQLTGDVAAARITTALNASGSAPIFAARAWVNFDGSTSPGTIRASGNVSSVTRSATGVFVVNLSTAMPDTNYAWSGSLKGIGGSNDGQVSENRDVSRTSSSIPIITRDTLGNPINSTVVGVIVFR